jgi:protein-S-isoprenylcysteine O-methyltransferase Ste14
MQTPEDATYAGRPNRWPLPPLLLVGCLLLGYAATWLIPVDGLPRGVLRIFGALFIGAGLALIVWASSTLTRAGTTILPHQPSTRLVTAGPFGFTRNPIYLGDALLIAGLGGIEASPWYGAAAVLFLVLVDRLAIIREEAHLAARFGSEWTDYSSKVRRWL